MSLNGLALLQQNALPHRNRLYSRTVLNGECLEWMGTRNEHGYGVVNLGKRGIKALAHRLSYAIYKGDISPGKGVLHKCDNPCCVLPEHLYLGTQQDNLKDMRDRNRAKPPPLMKLSRSGLRGISLDRGSGRWMAYTPFPVEYLYTGKDFFEACCRRKSWEATNQTGEQC